MNKLKTYLEAKLDNDDSKPFRHAIDIEDGEDGAIRVRVFAKPQPPQAMNPGTVVYDRYFAKSDLVSAETEVLADLQKHDICKYEQPKTKH